MSEHKAAAAQHLKFVSEFFTRDSTDWPQVNATVALTHATLELAEQQRIANLIALSGIQLTAFEDEGPASLRGILKTVLTATIPDYKIEEETNG